MTAGAPNATARADTDASAVVDGNRDGDCAAIVGLVDDMGFVFCTGTLVSPSDVLTAAHCVANEPRLRGVQIDMPAASSPVVFPCSGFEIHAGFDGSTLDHDVAVVRLARSPGITPIAVRGAPLGTESVGQRVTVTGLGTDVVGGEPPRKRTRSSRIGAVGPQALRLVAGPDLPCFGDSGAPVLAEVDGELQVVAVVSHGDAACADHATAIRVDTEPIPFAYGPAVGAAQVARSTARLAAAVR